MEIWNHSCTFNTRPTICFFMIAWNILNLAYFELNFPTERSEPMLKIKIYHLHRSE